MPEAALDLQRLAKNEPKAFAKANRFIKELESHPMTGLGHPEPLKGKPEGRWSREITKKHKARLSHIRNRSTCRSPLCLWTLR